MVVDCREDDDACEDLSQADLAAEVDGILDNRSASVGRVEADERGGGSEPAIMSHAEGVRSTRDASNCGLWVSTRNRDGLRFSHL